MRHEFPAAVKRAALARADGHCEAVGERYGFPEGVRCAVPVFEGHVNYEHYPRPAHDPDPETITLANCTAICPGCNRYANNKFDTPREAKMKRIAKGEAEHGARMARKAGLDVADPTPTRKPRPKMRSRGFAKGIKQKIPTRPFPRNPR